MSLIAVAGCSPQPEQSAQELACDLGEPPPALALMTSLPIYWPTGLDFEGLGGEAAQLPWQRTAIERCRTLVPLDTLSEDETGFDPLLEHKYLAVIQPRGLSPADNVALDDWVRAGGHLLLVLDPMLTGEYDLPLGDPARPVDTALIPPVVERWGMEIEFAVHDAWEDGIKVADLDGQDITIMHGGTIAITDPSAARCTLYSSETIARCDIGEGTVTLMADAALFEHREVAGEGAAALNHLLKLALP